MVKKTYEKDEAVQVIFLLFHDLGLGTINPKSTAIRTKGLILFREWNRYAKKPLPINIYPPVFSLSTRIFWFSTGYMMTLLENFCSSPSAAEYDHVISSSQWSLWNFLTRPLKGNVHSSPSLPSYQWDTTQARWWKTISDHMRKYNKLKKYDNKSEVPGPWNQTPLNIKSVWNHRKNLTSSLFIFLIQFY